MTRDDCHVIVYRILSYLYMHLKALMYRSLDLTGIEHGNEHIKVFNYFFWAKLDIHLMKYRNIYVLETKYTIIINYSILLHISV